MSMKVKPTAAAMMPKASSSPAWEEEDAAEDAEAEQLTAAVQMWVQARKETAQQKSTEILKQLQVDVEASLQKMDAAIQKESKEALKGLKSEFAGIEKELVGKYEEIKLISSRYNKEMNKAWEGYSVTYSRLTNIKANADAQGDKRKAALKRKLEQMEGDIGGLMAEAEKKLSKCRASTQKMPGVLKMLQSIM